MRSSNGQVRIVAMVTLTVMARGPSLNENEWTLYRGKICCGTKRNLIAPLSRAMAAAGAVGPAPPTSGTQHFD